MKYMEILNALKQGNINMVFHVLMGMMSKLMNRALEDAHRAADQIREAEDKNFRSWVDCTSARYEREYRALEEARFYADLIREAEEEEFRSWISITSLQYERDYEELDESLHDAIYDWSFDMYMNTAAHKAYIETWNELIAEEDDMHFNDLSIEAEEDDLYEPETDVRPTFGRYPQGNDEVDPIEWIVLDVRGNKALLLSRYGLDSKPYNEKYTDITWEKCTLLTWLNSTFLNTAFSAEEQKAILTTTVDNSKSQGYSGYSTDGGNNTQDKVFLLSYAEAWKYFEDDNARKCAPTEYALKRGAYTSSSNKVDGKVACWWWLRSPGFYQNFVAAVTADGSHSTNDVIDKHCTVRPAIWVDLDALPASARAVLKRYSITSHYHEYGDDYEELDVDRFPTHGDVEPDEDAFESYCLSH